jgi:hypothetical protein
MERFASLGDCQRLKGIGRSGFVGLRLTEMFGVDWIRVDANHFARKKSILTNGSKGCWDSKNEKNRDRNCLD